MVCFQGFFRRSLKRGASYVCTRDRKCDVTGERRNLCGYCRYQKCISLGMSKTGKLVMWLRQWNILFTRTVWLGEMVFPLELLNTIQLHIFLSARDECSGRTIVIQFVIAFEILSIVTSSFQGNYKTKRQGCLSEARHWHQCLPPAWVKQVSMWTPLDWSEPVLFAYKCWLNRRLWGSQSLKSFSQSECHNSYSVW